MNGHRHKNWFLAIFGVYLIPVSWCALAVALVTLIATYCFKPIYAATSVLAYDNELEHVLTYVQVSHPAVTSADYIRPELFAVHVVSMMSLPEIAGALIEKWNLKTADGKRLLPDQLVNPSILDLIFDTGGQGVDIQWVTDTQSFRITGFSRDLQQAVAFSRDYTGFVLRRNSEQFHELLTRQHKKFEDGLVSVKEKRQVLEVEILSLMSSQNGVDCDTEIRLLIEGSLTIKEELERLMITEKEYPQKFDQLQKEVKNLADLRRYQSILQTNPEITALRQQIRSVMLDLASLSIEYKADHPDYKENEAKLAKSRQILDQEVEKTLFQEITKVPDVYNTVYNSLVTLMQSVVSADVRKEQLHLMIQVREERLRKLSDVRARLTNLKADKATYDTLVNDYLKKMHMLEDLQSETLPGYRLVSSPLVDDNQKKEFKIFPQRKMSVALVLVISFFLFGFYVLAHEMHEERIYREWQIPEKWNIVSADIPRHLALGGAPLADEGERMLPYIRDVYAFASDAALIRVMSPGVDEGAEGVALAIARLLRTGCRRVIVVDGNLTAAGLTRQLGLADRPGLISCLESGADVSPLVISGVAEGCDLLPIGKSGDGGVLYDVKARMAGLLDVLKLKYEHVVFVDTPANVDRTMLRQLMAPHPYLLVVKAGKQALGDLEKWVRKPALLGSFCAPFGVAVVNSPYEADLLTVAGIGELLIQWCLAPWRWMRFLMRRRSP